MSSTPLVQESWSQRELRAALTAVQYFTRIPIPSWVGHSPAQLTRAARYFPFVGLLIGAIGALVLWSAAQVFPLLLAVILSCAATIGVTGAFHEDGLADTFDGLGGAFTRERALEIMKDSRIGTFGALALLLGVLLKITALAAMPIGIAVTALIAGHCLSRACAVMLMWTLPYARDDDSTRSKAVVENVTAADVAIAAVCGLAPLILVGASGVFALFGSGVTLLLLQRWFKRRLNGYTGDTLGATQQICEIVFYLTIVASWNSF